MASVGNDSDDLYQIAILIDQLKHDDVQLRTNASRNITKIARALGPERTRDELIPFLTECVDDEDEVIIVIAEELGNLCNYVGGTAHVFSLLAPLEMLICGEESAVRTQGIKAVERIVESMSDEHVCGHFYVFLIKLVNKDWFTARASAAALLHMGFGRLTEQMQEEVFAMFLRLCKDETPLVRKVAAQNLEHWTKLVKTASMMTEIISMFKAFTHDDQDSIRIQVVPITIAVSTFVTAEVKQADILPAVLEVARDKSWRVRWSVAHRLHEIMRIGSLSGDQTFCDSLCDVFTSLLSDAEPEVKAAAASHLAAVAQKLAKHTVLSMVIRTGQHLSTDPSDFVRSFFAAEVGQLAPLLGREDTVQHVLPLLLTLLRDESSEVRLNVISGLDAINNVIGVDLLSQSLLPAITELAKDSKWRVRLAVIENMPMLARQLGVDFLDAKLLALCMVWLDDPVFSIRKAAAENLQKLADIFGDEWTQRQILPRIKDLHKNAAFAKRMTALYALHVMLVGRSRTLAVESLFPIILSMTDDPVPNVRFTVAKILSE
ncbi:protein phosphatase 2, partial [Ochromonadaceae sp. CCMP2298]